MRYYRYCSLVALHPCSRVGSACMDGWMDGWVLMPSGGATHTLVPEVTACVPPLAGSACNVSPAPAATGCPAPAAVAAADALSASAGSLLSASLPLLLGAPCSLPSPVPAACNCCSHWGRRFDRLDGNLFDAAASSGPSSNGDSLQLAVAYAKRRSGAGCSGTTASPFEVWPLVGNTARVTDTPPGLSRPAPVVMRRQNALIAGPLTRTCMDPDVLAMEASATIDDCKSKAEAGAAAACCAAASGMPASACVGGGCVGCRTSCGRPGLSGGAGSDCSRSTATSTEYFPIGLSPRAPNRASPSLKLKTSAPVVDSVCVKRGRLIDTPTPSDCDMALRVEPGVASNCPWVHHGPGLQSHAGHLPCAAVVEGHCTQHISLGKAEGPPSSMSEPVAWARVPGPVLWSAASCKLKLKFPHFCSTCRGMDAVMYRVALQYVVRYSRQHFAFELDSQLGAGALVHKAGTFRCVCLLCTRYLEVGR